MWPDIWFTLKSNIVKKNDIFDDYYKCVKFYQTILQKYYFNNFSNIYKLLFHKESKEQ